MGIPDNFTHLLKHALQITCPRCSVEMTLRTLMPVADAEEYTATYRCPKCSTDTQREFSVPKSA